MNFGTWVWSSGDHSELCEESSIHQVELHLHYIKSIFWCSLEEKLSALVAVSEAENKVNNETPESLEELEHDQCRYPHPVGKRLDEHINCGNQLEKETKQMAKPKLIIF
ncbi:hypothetical protein Leryth_025328 [Lithospermum erythrorhizon]|nr:hypothetical protein Leryth_025328 [Lithospermum erythrorhizon]